ncbi:MAG: regulatory protein GemA [Ramlibacter sp.]|nr:regulatory protein GemA [Ramlibacter sp.]
MSKLARDHRNRELAQIHVAKKQFLDSGKFASDDDYRAMLWTQARVRSAAELDHAGRQKVLDYLKRMGFSATKAGARAKARKLEPRERLMFSLWQQLADAREVRDRRMPALLAFIKAQTGVDRLEWLNTAQQDLVIERLKRWLGRVE